MTEEAKAGIRVCSFNVLMYVHCTYCSPSHPTMVLKLYPYPSQETSQSFDAHAPIIGEVTCVIIQSRRWNSFPATARRAQLQIEWPRNNEHNNPPMNNQQRWAANSIDRFDFTVEEVLVLHSNLRCFRSPEVATIIAWYSYLTVTCSIS